MSIQAYEVKLYKDDTLIAIRTVDQDAEEYDFSGVIAEEGAGEYTCTVQAMGDGVQWRDGLVSEMSEARVVV